MSDRQQLAEHATGLGVVGLATMGLNAAPLIPLAVLAAWGIDRYKSCSQRKQRDTINRVVKQIEKANPDHRAVGPALSLLKENRHKVAVSPTTLAEAEKRGNFPDTLYDIVFAGVEVPKDDGIEALLRMVLTAAWQELRLEDDYHKVFVQESVTALERDLKDGFARIEARLTRVETRIDNIAEAVDEIATANRDLLEALAARFRIADAYDLPTHTLRAELEKRAEDYRSVLREIAALKGQSERIDNIHAAAMDAARNLRLDEAKHLLRDARTILRDEKLRPVLEQNAQLMVAEAEVELLDQNPDTAFTLLSAAADSFASLDPLEPARRRAGYEDLLYQHGLRYPGPALARAEQMNRDALATCPRATDAALWARLQNNLGIALGDLGTRAGDTAALQDAITAYRAALEVRTREASPMQWATTQNNLGITLRNLGTRAGDTTVLHDAVAAYRAALEVRTREASPMQWAMTQNNLGITLRNLGTRASDITALQDAVTAFRAALEVYTREACPMQWAMTQNNLGAALANLGTRAGDTAALQDAVSAYRAALEVRTREASPMDWAMTQNNLGTALGDLGTRAGDTAALQDAVTAYRAALEVYTREASPMQWAMTQNNLGAALRNLGTRAGDTTVLHDAVTAYRTALEVYTADAAPFPYGETMENLAIAHLSLANLPDPSDPAADLGAARQAIDAALAIYTPEHTPYHHEGATRLRERILAAQAAFG